MSSKKFFCDQRRVEKQYDYGSFSHQKIGKSVPGKMFRGMRRWFEYVLAANL